MSKKNFDLPYVLNFRLIPTPEPGSDEGQGSAQGTIDPYPCTWENWQTVFKTDMDGDGNFDMIDYCMWWQNNQFTYDQWIAVGNDPNDWING